MEQLLDIAKQHADYVEIYEKDSISDQTKFENSKLTDIESSRRSGVGLTLIKNGCLGYAYTRNLIDRDQLVGVEALDRPLILDGRGVEAVVQKILSGAARSADGAPHTVVVGRDETVGRHERSRASGYAQHRQTGPLEPRVIGVEAISVREVLVRRILERPHLPIVEPSGALRVAGIRDLR